MASISKKGKKPFNSTENKSFGYTIGDKFDLYKMTGLKKPQKKQKPADSEKK